MPRTSTAAARASIGAGTHGVVVVVRAALVVGGGAAPVVDAGAATGPCDPEAPHPASTRAMTTARARTAGTRTQYRELAAVCS
jgi:hypothetical protein